MTTVRPLEASDAPAVRALRLRALREDHDSFLSSYEEEVREPEANTEERLRNPRPDSASFGAFEDGLLVGMLHVARDARRKTLHRATLGGMYVAPESRAHGHAQALLDAAIERMRGIGVEQIHLCVSTTADSARRLYRRAGFEVVGELKGAIKDGERYIDEELMVLRLRRQEPGRNR